MALAKVNAENARMFGSDDDYVAVAPLSATFAAPTALTPAAPTPFVEVGWLGPDGLNLTPNDEVSKLKGFQGGRVIRTVVTSSETSVSFQALESTLLTLGLSLGLKDSTTTAKITKHTLPGSRVVESRQFLVGLFDGTTKGCCTSRMVTSLRRLKSRWVVRKSRVTTSPSRLLVMRTCTRRVTRV